jgi:hypothetical protein
MSASSGSPERISISASTRSTVCRFASVTAGCSRAFSAAARHAWCEAPACP